MKHFQSCSYLTLNLFYYSKLIRPNFLTSCSIEEQMYKNMYFPCRVDRFLAATTIMTTSRRLYSDLIQIKIFSDMKLTLLSIKWDEIIPERLHDADAEHALTACVILISFAALLNN